VILKKIYPASAYGYENISCARLLSRKIPALTVGWKKFWKDVSFLG